MIEKAESEKLEGLCSVRSSKARRLRRIRPGNYNQQGGKPITVLGMNWFALIVMGMSGPLTLAVMRWWNQHDPLVSQRSLEHAVLRQCAQAWGKRILHLFDRG